MTSSNFEHFWLDSVPLHESLTREVLKMVRNSVQIQFNVPVVDFFRPVEFSHVPTQVVEAFSPGAAAATRTSNLVTQRVQFHDVELRCTLAERAYEIGLGAVVLEFEQEFFKPHVASDFHLDPLCRQNLVNSAIRIPSQQ